MTPNDQVKMKALQRIMKDMDGMHGQSLMARVKPKKAVVAESISVQPKEGSPMEEAREPMVEKMAEGDVPGMSGAKPDLSDEDSQRLMHLYSQIK